MHVTIDLINGKSITVFRPQEDVRQMWLDAQPGEILTVNGSPANGRQHKLQVNVRENLIADVCVTDL